MIERINALITENYSNRLLIKETEFKAPQAQINPLLYNTLESVNWLAKMNKQTQISDMVQALAFLLRNSVSLKEPILTLGEELEIVRNYVLIQKFRFEDRLEFTLDVKEQDLHRKIPSCLSSLCSKMQFIMRLSRPLTLVKFRCSARRHLPRSASSWRMTVPAWHQIP